MNEQSAYTDSTNRTVAKPQPLWIRIVTAIVMFIVVGSFYTVFYGFWVGMSAWADMKPSDADTAERFYLTYVWGSILVVLLIVPFIVTLTRARWLWKWSAWLISIVLSVVTWSIWFLVIELSSK
ncbi:MAG TPA: hypothetical protein PKA39_13055 [Ignavibacteria bacterium]|nr:hypothetical protein [Ignavibacteria bacterium]